MAQILDLGKFRFDYRGSYNAMTQYERNDVVTYGGNVYVYKLTTASAGNEPTDTAFWDLMVEGFNYRGIWAIDTQYLISDLVSYGGKIYIALQDTLGGNPVTSTSNWSVFVDGIQYEGTWSSSTQYQKGDVVKYGGNIWIAVNNNSNSTPTTLNANWDILVYGVEWKGAYNDATAYKVNDIVSYGGKSYICIAPGTGFEPAANPANWAIFSSGFQWEGQWSSLTNYQAGDVVGYGGLVYVATADSLNSAPTDPLYWAVLIEGIAWKGTYNALATYNKNDIVSFGGSSWIAKQNTTGNSPIVGANWDTLAQGTFPSFVGSEGYFLSNDGTSVIWTDTVTVAELTANSQIFVGANAPDKETDKDLTNAVAVFSFDNGSEDSSFAQIAFTNADRTSSTDIQVIANNGNDSSGWASFGITGSDFDDTTYGITGPGDAYIFFSAPEEITKTITNKALTNNVATLTTGTAHGITVGAKAVITGVDATFNGTYYVTEVPTTTTFRYAKTASNVTSAAVSPAGSVTFNAGATGNLVFATGANGTDNKIIFAAGGFDSGLTQMEITPGVNVHIEIPTPSTSPTTGALTVVGGVGIQGAMNIAGNVAIVGTLTFGGSGTTTVVDTLSTADSLVRSAANNTDDLLDLGIVSEYTVAVSNVVRDVSNKVLASEVATLTTTAAHTYSVGDVVVVTGVDATFNGTVVVTAVTSNTFSYRKTGAANVTSAAVSPVGTATKTRERRWYGIVRDATDGVTKVFDGLTSQPGSTVDFSNGGLVYDAVRMGGLTATTINSTGGITSTSAANSLSDLTISGSSSSFGGTIAGNATFTGNPTFSGTPIFSGSPSFTGTPTFTGGVRVQEMIEDVIDVALSSNVATLDYSQGNIFWTSSTPSANMTWNITNAPTTDGRVFTINVLVTQGSTGYIPSTITINGSSVGALRWAAGVTPTPTSSSGKIDIFTIVVVRRASAFTALVSANLNF